ncbi:PREDICTED: uncharacterized protein LOC109478630 [Branchiostoma belcheri]|uniref:Uncharacterized protein LOC109478630 n=1 Tax=Branchiostoma belcheri TaxID=7741 RepID=A0A6P4ZGJ3_BRABE|nr:PREDICTED: uncharacterized protein LOC109478630 [Branchiostoma belcheri]
MLQPSHTPRSRRFQAGGSKDGKQTDQVYLSCYKQVWKSTLREHLQHTFMMKIFKELVYEENKDVNITTAGKEALRDGKSLHVSGHVQNLRVHAAHPDSPYCFVRCSTVRETSVSLPPYDTWIIVHKSRNILVDGYCTCPGGFREHKQTQEFAVHDWLED